MHRIILSFVVVFLFSGYGWGQVRVTAVKSTVTRDGCRFELSIPRVVGMKDAAVQHNVNALLQEQFAPPETDGAVLAEITFEVELLTSRDLSVLKRTIVTTKQGRTMTLDGVTVDLPHAYVQPFKNLFRQGAPYAVRLWRFATAAAARRMHEVPRFKTDFEDASYYLTPKGLVLVNLFDAHTLAAFRVEIPYVALADLIDAFGPLVPLLQAASPHVVGVPFATSSPHGRYEGAWPRVVDLGTDAGRKRVNAVLARSVKPPAEDESEERFTDRTVFKVGLATSNLVSIAMDTIRFTEHGRPMRHYQTFTFDPRTGRFYTFRELFRPGSDYAARLRKLVTRAAAAQQGSGPADPDIVIEHRDFSALRYYLTAGNLVIIDLFDQNVAADTEVAIPYGDLRDILDPKGPLGARN